MKRSKTSNEPGLPAETRWWDPLTAFLLVAALLTSATRLTATQWTKDLGLTQTVAFLAVILGLAIGQSRFNRFWSIFFGIAYGVIIVPWQLGLTMSNTIEWKERLVSIAGRLQTIVGQILTRQSVTDSMFFLFLMGLLFWILGITAGYWLTRYGEPWKVILPAGITTFIIDSFDPLLTRRAWYLAVYIFLALLLLARIFFLRMRTEWQVKSVHFPQDIGYDLSRFAAIVSLVIVIVSWNIPSLSRSFPAVTEFYRTIRAPYLSAKERIGFMFAALRASVGMVSDYYGDQQGLGTGTPKSDTILMEVRVPMNVINPPRYYWRARVYDEYKNGIWSTSIKSRRQYLPNEENFDLIDSPKRIEGDFAFRFYTPIISVYAAPQPLKFSRPGVVQYSVNGDQTFDLVGLRADPFIRPGEEYTVRSRLSTVTIRQLRQAGTDYPLWVSERYLTLPDNISPRTRELARQITAGLENPYDKTQAITEWLRDNIEYMETISAPPAGREPVDWFLFDYRKGFCNYYSSAEIVLLRSLGIPARWAIGYAQGESRIVTTEGGSATRQNALVYTVREKDAHAWPEVFFPGVGWIEFEPTVSQLPILRPSGEETADENPEEEDKEFFRETPQPDDLEALPEDLSEAGSDKGIPAGVILSGIIAAGALVLALFALIYRRTQNSNVPLWVRIIGGDEKLLLRWQREKTSPAEKFRQSLAIIGRRVEGGLSQIGIEPPEALRNWTHINLMSTVSRAYMEINWALERLKKIPSIHDTPRERAKQLNEYIPEATPFTQDLLAEYQKESYSTSMADPESARQAAAEIRKLSYQVRIKNILNKVQERL